nr:hypothetical protein [Tanacetum cinerariifolium]
MLDGGSDVLNGGIMVVEVVVKRNGGGICKEVMEGCGSRQEIGGVKKIQALGASGETSILWVMIAWLVIGIFLRGFLVEELALEAMQMMIKERGQVGMWFKTRDRGVEKTRALKASGKTSILWVGIAWLVIEEGRDQACSYPPDLFLLLLLDEEWERVTRKTLWELEFEGKIERFFDREIIKHVAETSIRVIFVSCETYGILAKDWFPFLEIDF